MLNKINPSVNWTSVVKVAGMNELILKLTKFSKIKQNIKHYSFLSDDNNTFNYNEFATDTNITSTSYYEFNANDIIHLIQKSFLFTTSNSSAKL